MRISHGTRLASPSGHNGYGYATNSMLDSLTRLGYHVSANDSSADVEIWFDQPHHWSFSKDTYRIGYHPWESTELKPGWSDIMNQCDEIWTPSPLIAQWYEEHAGVKVPVYVYEHGIEPVWSPEIRDDAEGVSFLHVGAEAARKGGWDALRRFRTAFAGTEHDVQFTLKTINHKWTNISRIGKTNIINRKMDFDELRGLFYDNNAYVYPSYGEGFGFTPLQAIASSMPTITVPGWAPYSDYLEDELGLPSKMVKSPWPDIHPGYMLRPDLDVLEDKMMLLVENYEYFAKRAHERAPDIHKAYNWDDLTSEAFKNLEKRL